MANKWEHKVDVPDKLAIVSGFKGFEPLNWTATYIPILP